MAVGVLAACVWTRCRFATGELALQPPRPRRSPSYSKLELSLLASAWLGGIATIASSDIARAQSGPFLLARTALAGLVAAVMPTAVRAVMLTIALLAFGNAAQANCDANGIITGANGAIVLGSAGCATAPGVTSATVVTGATVTAAGVGVTSVASPGWAVTNQGTITATGNGITGNVSFTLTNSGAINAGSSGALLGGGSTVVNSIGGTITGAFTGLSISANGGSTSGGPSTVDNAGTISSTSGFNTAIVLGLGGTVTNRSTGTISAIGVGVAGATNPTTVNNFGQILDASTAIGLSAGGTVTNGVNAVISSSSRGVDISGGVGTVENSGSILASAGRAVQLQAGGSVTNTSTGTITSQDGGTRAIFVFGGPSTIVNAGSVSGGVTAAIEVESTQSSITNSGTITSAAGAGIQLDPTGASNTLTTIVNNAGGTIQGAVNALVANGNASVDFTNKGTVIGNLVFGAGDAALHFYTGSSLTGNLTAGTGTNTISFNGSGNGTFSNPIANFQTITKQDDGTWTLSGVVSGATAINVTQGTLILSAANTYSGGTTVTAGMLSITNGSAIGTGALALGQGTAFQLDGSFTLANSITIAGDPAFDVTGGNTATISGVIADAPAPAAPGVLEKIGAGTLVLTGANTYSGGTIVSAGTLQLGPGGSLAPTGALTVNAGGTFDLNNFSQTVGDLFGAGLITLGSGTLTAGTANSTLFAGTITGTGGLVKQGSGALMLTGTSSYSGATAVNAGALIVNGSIASSSLATVNSGAALIGSGTVGTTVVNAGGFFVPGPVRVPGTMTVAGNLALQSGAFYVVQVNPTTASTTNVSGTASLAGTVGAIFFPGTYMVHSYPILTAGGGLTGTFNALATLGLPPDFQTSLTYTGNTAFLNLRAQLVPEPTLPPTPPTPTQPIPIPPVLGLPPLPEQPPTPLLPPFTVNQLNVGHAIDNFFNNGGALPPAFVSLFGLTGSNLTNALSQLSGEPATGAQKVAFQLTDQFLNMMLDPFVDGRSGVGGADHPALGFAPERETMPPDIALAYASVFKAPPAPVPVYEPRWTAWGGAYGGSNRTTGDLAVIGSHDLSARTVGFAAGLDYHLTPDTVAGFAFAGGGTDWSLSQGLGGGKSDAFQAGVYGATRSGPAYLAAAFAFANHWMSTDRFAVGDHLTANFGAQSYGGRLEGGYRFGMSYGGITPYAAIQAQSFHTPSLTETDAIANGFALAFGSRDAADTRGELGARFDRVLAVYSNAVLALRGRLAWAHDWVSDPTLVPVFQALPGASFIVDGATPAKNSALASAGAELRLANGVTLLGKFDGEFASHSATYAGTGTLRYRW
jgi:autotransporter-associated beta strand protein